MLNRSWPVGHPAEPGLMVSRPRIPVKSTVVGHGASVAERHDRVLAEGEATFVSCKLDQSLALKDPEGLVKVLT